ncbi:MAG: aspartyl/glutamyl-tRNA amidotransferase subunit C, partial [Spirosomaceae bacterium]|nr:aspartyl/glutamyl-tRNA amidotransferase subunit C [Spirosomataceae bacterium]
EVNVMRDDIANNTLSREEGLLNAPSKVGKYFGVPKVIE